MFRITSHGLHSVAFDGDHDAAHGVADAAEAADVPHGAIVA
jgi:hypothetical protein